MNELELILTDTFNCTRADLYLNSSSILLKDKDYKRLDRILRHRGRQVPIQYVLGYAEFMGLRFKVRQGVLIPRPETEILVEAVMERAQKTKNRIQQKINILDIGTGSGCIAVSLAKFLKNVIIVAMDISHDAINLAKENARLHDTEDKIKFLTKDIFSVISKEGPVNRYLDCRSKFDVIVTNPPYVPTLEIGMFDGATIHEPRVALDGGRDGLDFYRGINKSIGTLLKKEGYLIMEAGYNQVDKIKEIFSSGWSMEEFKKDYQGIERVCIIRKNTNG